MSDSAMDFDEKYRYLFPAVWPAVDYRQKPTPIMIRERADYRPEYFPVVPLVNCVNSETVLSAPAWVQKCFFATESDSCLSIG